MSTFKEQLDKLHTEALSMECPPPSRLAFTGSYIFDFTTYDDAMDIVLATTMFEVLECIVNKTNFEYQKENYYQYIIFVNMPFLVEKLEWGTSIRGAWLDEYKDYEIHGGNFKVLKGQLEVFIRELIEWVKTDRDE